jgi:hypothetical protein
MDLEDGKCVRDVGREEGRGGILETAKGGREIGEREESGHGESEKGRVCYIERQREAERGRKRERERERGERRKLEEIEEKVRWERKRWRI